MTKISATIADGFIHYFQEFRDRVHVLSGALTNDQFWRKPYPYGNSFGNLVLHLSGNLNYYIGSQIKNSGYIRDRELEFREVQNVSKDEALARMDDAVATVIKSLGHQNDQDWSLDYYAIGVDDVHDRFSIYLRCSNHFHHHIGQMIYLVKAWSNANTDLPG